MNKEIGSVVCSDTGRKRKANEDATLMLSDAGIFCLADGMGGIEGGAVASQQTLKIVSNSLGADARILSFTEKIKRIKQALLNANRWIRNWAASRGNKGSGTTFVGLILDFAGRGRTCFLHAGDSRGYRFRKGTLRQITRDHSVATAFGGRNNVTIPPLFKNVIMNAIGAQETFSLEQTPAPVETGDLFLLCSDGLTTMLPDPEIARILAGHADANLDATARALVQAANDAGGLDNITVMLVSILAPLHTDTDEEDQPATDTHDILLDTNQLPPGDETHPEPPSTDDSEVLARSPSNDEPTADHDRALRGRRRSLTWAIGAALLVALAVALYLQTRKGAEAMKPAAPIATNAASRQQAESATPEKKGTPRAPIVTPYAPVAKVPTLTDQELKTLLRDHIESGRLDELNDRLQQDTTLREQLKSNRKEFDAFSGWFSEWSRNFNAPDAVAADFQSYRQAMHKLSKMLGVAILDESEVSWPADAADRASLKCRLINRQQNRVADAALSIMKEWEVELAALGDKPDQTLAILETIAAQPGLRETAAAIRTGMTDFRRWIARSRTRPISSDDWERVAVPFASDLQKNMVHLRQEVWSLVMALSPESLRGVMPSDEVSVVLEIKRRNLASLGERDAQAVWADENSRSRLRTILNYLCAVANTGGSAVTGPETTP
jgi:PPM family protein phosphatase